MKTDCENCMNFGYNEFFDSYECLIDVDEDEYVRMLGDKNYTCPYYRQGDEYTIVRKQN